LQLRSYGIAKAPVNLLFSTRQLLLAVTRLLAGTVGGTMGLAKILASIDHQIAQLEQVRALLAGAVHTGNGHGARGVSRLGSAAGPAKRKRRNLTPEGRKRIADAVKRRWEAHRKAAAAAQN
jgi:hypothetical protein